MELRLGCVRATNTWMVGWLFIVMARVVLMADLTKASDQLKLIQDLLESYDSKAKPTWDNNQAINVTFSMDLYQLLELNEPMQYILLNAWIIERWHDEFLFWNPLDYGNITEVRLPYHSIWMPDTTLYNSLVMKDDDTRRLLNAKLTTNITRKAVFIELLYPTIYKFSCLLNLRYFPFDLQVCTMTFSSWTYDQKGINYFPYEATIGTTNFLENEGWYLFKTSVKREEVKYSCCPNKYTLLRLTLFLRRKPLFYLVNLIIPTSIITLIAIVGFFTTSSASGMREEKVSLGITTLLSMSILMLMVSDQMPTTSTFIPLIGWFILGMIIVISEYAEAPLPVDVYKKPAKIHKKLEQLPKHNEGPSPQQKKRNWYNVFNSSATNGIPNDKSTDPLMQTASFQSEDGLAQRLVGISNPIDNLPTGMQISFDDMLSQNGSDYGDSKPPTSRSQRINRGKIPEGIGTFNENIRQSRQLAQKEYEWLATVMERCFFIVFVLIFMLLTAGINLIGYFHWSDIQSIIDAHEIHNVNAG